MEKHFLTELDSLKDHIIKMATMVDDQVEMAFQALEDHDLNLSGIVKRTDREIDAYDNLIQTQTENLLALFQPVAVDLRFIITAIMVNNQLERCGDIAVNIAQRVKKTVDYKDLIAESQVLEMGKISRVMVKDAIDSFINRDTNLAKTVMERDDTVDALNKKAFNFLVEKMENGPEYVKSGAHLLILSRHIERLADHATNIAEDVVFMVDARLMTHAKQFGLQEE
jgi:phosphate transport system regulatory protein PhoU